MINNEREELNAAQITEELALDPRTVRKILAQKQFLPRKISRRPGKLDPFKNDIVRMLNGLKIPDFSAINPAARHWLDTISNVRIHGETHQKPIDLFGKERLHLNPVPVHPFDIGTVSQVRASSQFRITLDTNRYSVPAEYAGIRLTLKTYPDRANLLEQRSRFLPEPGALHLTRRKDLLKLKVRKPDLTIYEKNERSRND